MLKKLWPLLVGLAMGLVFGSVGLTGASAATPAVHSASAPAVSTNGNVILSVTYNPSDKAHSGYPVTKYRYDGMNWVSCGKLCTHALVLRKGSVLSISLPKGWTIVGSTYIYAQDTKTGVLQVFSCGSTSASIKVSVINPLDSAVFASLPLVSATIVVHRPGSPVPSYDTATCNGMK